MGLQNERLHQLVAVLLGNTCLQGLALIAGQTAGHQQVLLLAHIAHRDIQLTVLQVKHRHPLAWQIVMLVLLFLPRSVPKWVRSLL